MKLSGYNVVGVIILGIGMMVAAAITFLAWGALEASLLKYAIFPAVAAFFLVISASPRIAEQWEKAVVLRLGKFRGVKGPGLFWVVPFIDRVPFWIDMRIRTTGFAAEKTLTMDTVPVNVDAVLFWVVTDAEKAALELRNYADAVAWSAQTALRDIIGKTHLSDMLTGREAIDEQLKALIDARSHDWGVSVKSVEIRDVVIPASLEDAMSRKAQAEREKQAREILGDAEVAIADKFDEASNKYKNNPVAFQLRAMNILYEGIKEGGSLMIIPSSMTQSMDVGGYPGLLALADKQAKGDGGK